MEALTFLGGLPTFPMDFDDVRREGGCQDQPHGARPADGTGQATDIAGREPAWWT
jgi:hypothetical protein